MPNSLYINGKDYSTDVLSGLKKFTLELSKNKQTQVVGKAITSDMVLEGDAYLLLKSIFYDTCDCEPEVPIRLSTDQCGGLTVDLMVSYDIVSFDPCKCTATISPKTVSPETKCYDYLNSYTWWQNDLCKNVELPLQWYCKQPQNVVAMLALRQALATATGAFYYILQAIIIVLTGICELLTLGFGNCDLQDLNFVGRIFQEFDEWITGCGRRVPVVKVKDVLEYQAKQCGLKFKSNIYQEPSIYCNEVLFCAESGNYMASDENYTQDEICEIFESNAPVETTMQLLQKLSKKYYAEFCIRDGCLEFNRINPNKKNEYPVVCDLTQDCESVEYIFITEQTCASRDFSYCKDGVDQEGNKAWIRHYQDIVSYVDNPDELSECKKGLCQELIDFAPARFMFDEESCTRDRKLDFDLILDIYRSGDEINFLGFLPISIIPFQMENPRSCDMLMTSNQTTKCKLLILKEDYDPLDAQIIKKKIEGDTLNENVDCYAYNYPNWFKQDLPEILGESEMINNFWGNAHPDLNPQKMSIPQASKDCDCDVIESVLENNVFVGINTHKGVGVPESVEVEFGTTPSIQMNNIKICCD